MKVKVYISPFRFHGFLSENYFMYFCAVEMKRMSRDILKIAVPSVVTNITIPLLGLFDVGIAGHLGRASFIAAVSVGAMMFNLIYWNFGFLRMGTSGMTAQAYGKKDFSESALTLKRAVTFGLVGGVAIVALQYPLQSIALWVIGPSPAVRELAVTYFGIGIWGAPATLMMMAIKGWFLGMQDSKSPMFISVGVNVVNIVVSLIAVFVLKMGFPGIAVGTLTAEWLGLVASVLLVKARQPWIIAALRQNSGVIINGAGRFFKVNGDIFLRSFMLMIVNLAFVTIGARSGDLILAVNALMMQLFTLFSYFMDGVAFAGEALVGKYEGQHNRKGLQQCIAMLFVWGAVITVIYTAVYVIFPRGIFELLSNDELVVTEAMRYHWWCVTIPVAGMAAFIWDGVFIGLTRTREMAVAVLMAALSFFAVYALAPVAILGDHALWLAFVSYLALRGLVQTAQYMRLCRKTIEN